MRHRISTGMGCRSLSKGRPFRLPAQPIFVPHWGLSVSQPGLPLSLIGVRHQVRFMLVAIQGPDQSHDFDVVDMFLGLMSGVWGSCCKASMGACPLAQQCPCTTADSVPTIDGQQTHSAAAPTQSTAESPEREGQWMSCTFAYSLKRVCLNATRHGADGVRQRGSFKRHTASLCIPLYGPNCLSDRSRARDSGGGRT